MQDLGPMPDRCNGLMRLDETKDFCKENCLWGRKAAGRHPVSKEARQKRSNWGKVKNPKSICLVLEKDHLDFIKSQALQKSVQAGHFIEPNDLIREALQKAYPAPKQFDMFGDRK